ncbi:MAG: sulfurtransferase TusA family protein [Syntrophomonadaceae bacterium]|nr:sulfurtransferase TusA family protein [Syntrophomonadaceae bacterium]
MGAKKANAFVDITDVKCPITFVKAKVAIEELDDGQVLEIRMNNGEPVQNVPRSLKDEGHKVLNVDKNSDATYTVLVEKGGLE